MIKVSGENIEKVTTYLFSIRYSPAALKSSNTFCLFVF